MDEQRNQGVERENEQADRRHERLAETLGKAADGLIDVGRLWAAHGLNVGRSALEASAATLRTTAAVLGDLSAQFAAEDEPEQKPAA